MTPERKREQLINIAVSALEDTGPSVWVGENNRIADAINRLAAAVAISAMRFKRVTRKREGD